MEEEREMKLQGKEREQIKGGRRRIHKAGNNRRKGKCYWERQPKRRREKEKTREMSRG